MKRVGTSGFRDGIGGRARASRAALAVALCAGFAWAPQALADPAQTEATAGSDEIIVTANRRDERAQDVATSLDVLAGKSLEKRGADDFEDYLATVSSLGYSRDLRGGMKIGIRGVSNVAGSSLGIGTSVSTVGLYLNDVPIQGSAGLPDLGLYDLQRIEVLKGPQGTLYGEGSMGGAIKMILAVPELDRVSGKAQGELSFTDGADPSYTTHAAVNLPLIEDKLGLRVTGSYRRDAGFVHNAALDRDMGDTRSRSIRVMLRARPSESLTIDLLGLYQRVTQDGFNEVTVGAPDLRRDIPDRPYNRQNFKLGAATIAYDLSGATIASATAYWESDLHTLYRNIGASFDNYSLYGFGLPGFTQADPQGIGADIRQKAFTEEVRISSAGDGPFRWTLGGIYRWLKLSGVGNDAVPSALINSQIQANAAGLAPIFALVGGTVSGALLKNDQNVYSSAISTRYEGVAGYANASYSLSNTLAIELGLRVFRDTYRFDQQDRLYGIYAYDAAFYLGPLEPDGSLIAGTFASRASDDGVIPKFGISWKPAPGHMLYAQVTKGFRDGGTNYVGTRTGVPLLFKSDSSWNYEVGTKNQFWDDRVTANAALYWIDWSDIQLRVGGFPSYLVNAGDARIYGGELSVTARLLPPLTAGFNLGLLDSKLTRVTNTSVGAIAGEPIPNAPKTTLSGFAEYQAPLGAIGNGVLRAEYEYRGSQAVNLITTGTPRAENFVKAYGVVRVQAGIEGHGWSGYLFVNNLFDSRGQVGRTYIDAGFPGYSPETTLQLVHPRVFGTRVSLDF